MAACCAACARADSFGRFGYGSLLNLPDMEMTAAGFRARSAGADRFLFPSELQTMKATATGSVSQTVDLGLIAGCPSKARASLVGNSLDLYYPHGFTLKLNSQAPPFLSWKEGTVGPKVPTPDLAWVLISFQTQEPPVVLGFSGAKASLTVTGKPGSWLLACPTVAGWVRVLLPMGLSPASPTDDKALGALSIQVSKDDGAWSAPTPTISGVKLDADDFSIDAEWTFDGPGAVVPPALQFAPLGGYQASILSPHHPLEGAGSYGPYEMVDGNRLKVHFPIRKIAPGKAVGFGEQTAPLPVNPSPRDIPGVVSLGLLSMLSGRTPALATLADDLSSRYLVDATYVPEPATAQQLPFAADGTGVDVAAAHALLAQASLDAMDSRDGNALFDSVLCKRDWWTWTVWTSDPNVCRRSSALAAIAGALSGTSSSRLLAATLEAGLDAQRGFAVWQRRKGLIPSEPSLIEPLLGVREGLFALNRVAAPGLDFFKLLQSPLRIGLGSGVSLERSGTDNVLSWRAPDVKPGEMTFLGMSFLQLAPEQNLETFTTTDANGMLTISYKPKGPGPCAVTAIFPPGFAEVPKQVAPPAYTE